MGLSIWTQRPLSGKTAIPEVVIDASVLVEYLVPGTRFRACAEVLDGPSVEILVPDLAYVEVANAFRKMALRELIAFHEVAEMVDDLLNIETAVVSSRTLLPDVVDHLGSLTAYDACYLALAQAADCQLATLDKALGIKARVSGIQTVLA